jgi:hypothetical protein
VKVSQDFFIGHGLDKIRFESENVFGSRLQQILLQQPVVKILFSLISNRIDFFAELVALGQGFKGDHPFVGEFF